jgi:hypothetical protein
MTTAYQDFVKKEMASKPAGKCAKAHMKDIAAKWHQHKDGGSTVGERGRAAFARERNSVSNYERNQLNTIVHEKTPQQSHVYANVDWHSVENAPLKHSWHGHGIMTQGKGMPVITKVRRSR